MPYLHQLYMIWLVGVLLNDYTRTTNLAQRILKMCLGLTRPFATQEMVQPWSRTVGGEEEYEPQTGCLQNKPPAKWKQPYLTD